MTQRVAIVTGASSGMGEALTRELVNRGWFVAMADLKPNDDLLKDLGSSTSYHYTDVASYSSQASTFDAVYRTHGRIDALLANAGITDQSSLYIFRYRSSDTIPPAPNLSCTDVDWKGVVYGTQLAIHFMRKNEPKPGGVIVATASIAGIHPHSTYAEYNGAKAAVINFVRGVAPVLHLKENIRINCVLPGIVHTKIIPPQLVNAVNPAYMTPISTITDAYCKFLDNENAVGQAVECSAEKQIPFSDPPMLNGPTTKRAVTVWEPLFRMMHGEDSGLSTAIPGEDIEFKAGS